MTGAGGTSLPTRPGRSHDGNGFSGRDRVSSRYRPPLPGDADRGLLAVQLGGFGNAVRL